MLNRQKGFTLVEILIVISILVVLGLIALVAINPMTQIFKGYDSRRRADLNKIKIAMEAYYSDHGHYPQFPLTDSKGRPSYVCNSDFLKPYLESFPCDPNTKRPYIIYLIPQGSDYPQKYSIYAQIFSFFEEDPLLEEYCPNMIEDHSTEVTDFELIYGCSQVQICNTRFGCMSGACVIVSEGEFSSCKYNWCDPDCLNLCSNPKYSCN